MRAVGLIAAGYLGWYVPLGSAGSSRLSRRFVDGVFLNVCVVFRVSGLGDDNEVLWRKLVFVVSPCGEREVDSGVLIWFVAPQILLVSVEGEA